MCVGSAMRSHLCDSCASCLQARHAVAIQRLPVCVNAQMTAKLHILTVASMRPTLNEQQP